MSDIKIYGKLNRVTADEDGRSPIVDKDQVDGLTEELENKQDKLPVNMYSSNQTLWCITPPMTPIEIDGITYTQGFTITKDKYDEFKTLEEDPDRNSDEMFVDAVKAIEVDGEYKYYYVKPYYLKRLSKYSPIYGIITFGKTETKLKEMVEAKFVMSDVEGKPTITMNDIQYVIDHIATHEEPTDTTIAVRREDGSLIVETPDDDPFYAVNNKKLKQKLDELCPLADNVKVYPTDAQAEEYLSAADKSTAIGMKGWYRIAETPVSGNWSDIFHVNVEVNRGNCASDVIFVAERQHKNAMPSINVLSFNSNDNTHTVPKVRIVYESGKSSVAYLDVFVDRNARDTAATDGWPTENYTPEGNTAVYYKFTVQTLFNHTGSWKIIDKPELVSADVTTGYESIQKSLADSAWSKVTRPVTDINNLVTKDEISVIEGPQGPAGTTPVKGVDYFTEEEIEAMVQTVYNRIPRYDGTVVM